MVVVDCLTLWLSNLSARGDRRSGDRASRSTRSAPRCARRRFHAIVVTNEVGMGIVPEAPLGARCSATSSGRAHQRLAALADEIHLAILGAILRLRPEPLRSQQPDEEPTA